VQIGPALDETGGMATVCRQMAALEFSGTFRVVHFATTCAANPQESFLRRIVRHLSHVVRLKRFIAAHDARVVHVHTCSGFSFFRSAVDAWIARRGGCRVVLHIHGAGFDQFCAQASAIEAVAIRHVLHKADAVIALSRGWAEALRTFAPRAEIQIVENAVAQSAEEIVDCQLSIGDCKGDTREGIPDEMSARKDSRTSGQKVDMCRFLMLARMDTWKGVDDLLAACARLSESGRDFRLTLAGPEGSAGGSTELRRKIDALGLGVCVHYVGAVDGAGKEKNWNETDVLVQPSHQEGMPMSLLEAMMRGIPVVATRVGAVPEVITDGCEGLLVEARNVEELASALARMSDSETDRAAMGRAARELGLERFTLARLERDLKVLYDKVIQGATVTLRASRGEIARVDRLENRSHSVGRSSTGEGNDVCLAAR